MLVVVVVLPHLQELLALVEQAVVARVVQAAVRQELLTVVVVAVVVDTVHRALVALVVQDL
jgi:hypothetical protein